VAEFLAAKVKIIDERIVELQGLKEELLNRIRQQCPMSSDYS
jgi:hypothetical protein